MKADILTIKQLFQQPVRYIIPTFQRPYVWNQEDQWEPLWEDVRNTAEDYIETLASVGTEKGALAEAKTRAHFLGAVVLQQQPNAIVDLQTRHVIDGQQRLTTLQLLLDAAQEVFEVDGFPKESKQLRRMVLNDEDYLEETPNNRFKIWPTLVDRDAFKCAMSNELTIDGFEDAPIVQAHEFFKLQNRQWLGERPELASARAQALVTTLMGLLKTVVIDLELADDANIIFETLNARGTPLLASDLIKNSILHTAFESGMDSDKLYQQYWQGFDDAWWRAEVAQGRLFRPRIDVFLNYWLTMRTANDVLSSQVFPAFRKYAGEGSRSITSIVQDVKETGETYRQLETITGWSPEGTFLYRWSVMQAGVSTPLILWLFSKRAEIGEPGFLRALGAIESYLLRRMVCRMTTKDYNRLFLELLANVQNAAPEATADVAADFLSRQTADSRVWPTDSQIEEAFLSLPLYQLLTRGRLRLVLEGIEDALRSPKAEEGHAPKGLTIEHIMPQGWRQHWPLPDNSDPEAARNRHRLVQTVGNLTLVNKKLNPDLSNREWALKRGGLSKHSVLHLNKQLLEAFPETWDEACIRTRAIDLAARAIKIWPRPGSGPASSI